MRRRLISVVFVCVRGQPDFNPTGTPPTHEKMWDLRVEDSKGDALEWTNLNLLEVSEVTLHWNGKKATADVE